VGKWERLRVGKKRRVRGGGRRGLMAERRGRVGDGEKGRDKTRKRGVKDWDKEGCLKVMRRGRFGSGEKVGYGLGKVGLRTGRMGGLEVGERGRVKERGKSL
jgi:hypothetical protein